MRQAQKAGGPFPRARTRAHLSTAHSAPSRRCASSSFFSSSAASASASASTSVFGLHCLCRRLRRRLDGGEGGGEDGRQSSSPSPPPSSASDSSLTSPAHFALLVGTEPLFRLGALFAPATTYRPLESSSSSSARESSASSRSSFHSGSQGRRMNSKKELVLYIRTCKNKAVLKYSITKFTVLSGFQPLKSFMFTFSFPLMPPRRGPRRRQSRRPGPPRAPRRRRSPEPGGSGRVPPRAHSGWREI